MSSSRGRLVSRSRLNGESTPARGRARDSEAPAQEKHELPPYEPPSCPLNESAIRKLDTLRTSRDTKKYDKHLKIALDTIPLAAAACNDRLTSRRDIIETRANKRKQEGIEGADMPKEHKDAETYFKQLAKQVDTLTERSEKALRGLIDLGDEARMQDVILQDVEENIPPAPPARPARRQRDGDEEGGRGENEAPAEDAEILSAVELMKKAKAEYKTAYQAKSMMQRYGDSNDYKNYKRILHDAQNPGEDAPPLPRASTWFPDEENSSASRRRRNTTDNTNNGGEESDDEIIIESATTNLKCLFTLQYFKEPFSTNICPHTFEKSAITEYYNKEATAYHGEDSGGIKKFKCPQSGCEKMLTITDFHDDALMARKVKRALRSAAREEEGDDEDDAEVSAPRGTQRNRPQRIGSDDDDEMDVDQDEIRSKRLAKFKRESTRGLSTAPRAESFGPGDVEVMDMA